MSPPVPEFCQPFQTPWYHKATIPSQVARANRVRRPRFSSIHTGVFRLFKKGPKTSFHQVDHDMTADEAQSDPTCHVAILLPPLPSPQIRDLHQLNINKSNLPSLGALPRDTRRMTLTCWFWCTCWKQVCFSGHLYRFVTWLPVSRISLKHYKNGQERHR